MDPQRTEDPATGDLQTWLSRFREHQAALGLQRAVLINSVVYRENNAMTVAALAELGLECFRGIALLHPEVGDAELDALHTAGMRGVRLDFVYPGALTLAGLERLAPRLAERGWHAQIYLRITEHLDGLADRLQRLPVDVVLDHYGYPDVAAGVGAPSFRLLLKLLQGGKVWLKLSSLYRQSPAPHESMDPLVRAMLAVNPERLLWASNWPHVRYAGPMPDDAVQLNALARQVPDTDHYRRILVDNPATLYGF